MTDPLARVRAALPDECWNCDGAGCDWCVDGVPKTTIDARAALDELEKELATARVANEAFAKRHEGNLERIFDLEAQLAAQPKLEWRKLDPAKDCGVPMLFRMRVVVGNGVAPQRQSVEYWVDTVRERESEDEDGNIRGVFYDFVDGYGWDIDLVEAEAECLPIAAIAPTKGSTDG